MWKIGLQINSFIWERNENTSCWISCWSRQGPPWEEQHLLLPSRHIHRKLTSEADPEAESRPVVSNPAVLGWVLATWPTKYQFLKITCVFWKPYIHDVSWKYFLSNSDVHLAFFYYIRLKSWSFSYSYWLKLLFIVRLK